MEQQTELAATDEGRPVPPHRSGGGHPIVIAGAGSHGLALAVALATTGLEPVIVADPRRETGLLRGGRQEPISAGRRAEKDAAAIAKAEAKRQRKAAKRAHER